MASSSTTISFGFGSNEKDPYQTLGLSFGATDAEIGKAYRKLALQYHPDKQQHHHQANNKKKKNHISPEEAARKFHEVKEARSFLLDSSLGDARAKYDAAYQSRRTRQRAEEERDRTRSDRQKDMRESLRRREEEATAAMMDPNRPKHGQGTKRQRSKKKEEQEEEIDRIRKAGVNLKRQRADATAAAQRDSQQRRSQRRMALKERQVRIKWSRSRIRISHSEHTLAKELSQFGRVDAVELLGSKGNAALVTFASSASCDACVKAYLQSDTMRATFMDATKRDSSLNDDDDTNIEFVSSSGWDGESLEERKMRQAAERERILRRIQMEEEEEEEGNDKSNLRNEESAKRNKASLYPPEFPPNKGNELSPLMILEQMERDLFQGLVPEDVLAKAQITPLS